MATSGQIAASDAIITAQRELERVFPDAAKVDLAVRHIGNQGDARLRVAVDMVLSRKRMTVSGA